MSACQHAMIADTSRVLVVTGSGYGTAVLCHRIGEKNVTSVGVGPYLVEAATDRLASIGLHPGAGRVRHHRPPTRGIRPDRLDRRVPNIPVSWLKALGPGGRLVTTLADTGLVITADKTEDGGATGQVPCGGAGFMTARHCEDYPPADTKAPSCSLSRPSPRSSSPACLC